MIKTKILGLGADIVDYNKNGEKNVDGALDTLFTRSEAITDQLFTDLGNKADKDLSNIDSNIDYVVESFADGSEWYRIYKSGWVEQGGITPSFNNGALAITLPVVMASTDYNATYNSQTTAVAATCNEKSWVKTTTTLTIGRYNNLIGTVNISGSWEVKGFKATI